MSIPRKSNLLKCCAFALPWIAATCATSRAASLGLDFTGGGTVIPPPLATYGWDFTLSGACLVSSLGIWDSGADGLFHDHIVDLWGFSGGKPLASVDVTNAGQKVASTQTKGQWIFQTLTTPILLAAGSYVIGADYSVGFPDPSTDTIYYTLPSDTLQLSTTFGLTYGYSRYASNRTSAVDFPNAINPEVANLGPNLLLTLVPEPAGLTMTFVLAVAATCGRQRRA